MAEKHPSLPSRERGLKLVFGKIIQFVRKVAPLAGAWIEIYREPFIDPETDVAPLAGAWIEIGVAGAR